MFEMPEVKADPEPAPTAALPVLVQRLSEKVIMKIVLRTFMPFSMLQRMRPLITMSISGPPETQMANIFLRRLCRHVPRHIDPHAPCQPTKPYLADIADHLAPIPMPSRPPRAERMPRVVAHPLLGVWTFLEPVGPIGKENRECVFCQSSTDARSTYLPTMSILKHRNGRAKPDDLESEPSTPTSPNHKDEAPSYDGEEYDALLQYTRDQAALASKGDDDDEGDRQQKRL
ncbi:hypothetical protein B0H13DRAFT_2315771 [Mycena leptocephala]|nr:hypothetical protein B0H13DRAFT_2315771 [Mycena leptocephala]